MTATAKRYSGGLLEWLGQRIRQTRTAMPHYAAAHISRPLTQTTPLALTLAACRDGQQLSEAFSALQAPLNAAFYDCGSVSPALLLADNNSTGSGLSCHSPRPLSAERQNLLRRHALQSHDDCQRLSLAADDNLYLIRLHKVGFLLLQFGRHLPSQSRVMQRSAPLRQALEDGLTLYLQQQHTLTQAVINERRAQAAELHDSLAQVLGYLRIRSSRLHTLLSDHDDDSTRECAEDLACQTLLAYRQVRELIAGSRLQLTAGSLEDSIQTAVAEFERHSAIVFEVDNRCPQLSLNADQQLQLTFIVREALTNIVRHAHASHARISLRLHDRQLRLRVEDNGCGIAKNAGRSDSFGLGIMQERAHRTGAQLSVSQRPRGGTCVELTLTVNP